MATILICNLSILASEVYAKDNVLTENKKNNIVPSNDNSAIYDYLPGFNSLTDKQIETIHPQFISSIYSGIVSGLMAGLIVGIVIFLIQKWSESRQLRRSLDREVSIFKEEVISHLECVDAFALHDVEIMPKSAKLIMTSLENKPIDLWYENLPARRAFIEKLKQFQVVTFKFRSAANKFDNRLWGFIRNHNSNQDTISANDPPLYVYCVGKTIGLTDEEIIPFMEFSVVNGKPNMTATSCYKSMSNDEEILNLSSKYLDKRKELKSSLDELRKLLEVK